MSNSYKRNQRHVFDDDRDTHVKNSGKNHPRRRPKNDGIDPELEVADKYKADIEYFARKW